MLVIYIGRSAERAHQAATVLSGAGIVVRNLSRPSVDDPLLHAAEAVLVDGAEAATLRETVAALGNGAHCESPPLIALDADRSAAQRDALANVGGAWGSLSRPNEAPALPALVRAVIRRRHGHAHDVVRAGDLAIDLRRFRVNRHMKAMPLLRSEYGVLATLALHDGRVVTYERLVLGALAASPLASLPLLKTTVHTLRRKLRAIGETSVEIHTWQRQGYSLSAGSPSRRAKHSTGR